MLGESDYAVQIVDRAGRVLGEMPWDSINWGRVADDTADASASWTAPDTPDPVQIPAWVADVEPWEHTLVVWRTIEPDPVFVGPVRTCVYTPGSVAVTAKDPTSWFEHRRNYDDETFTDIDLAYIFGRVAQAADAQDPTGIQIIARACGITGTRVLRAAERALTMDLLRELARSGVDWTVAGKELLIGGPDLAASLGTLVLIDEACSKPQLTKAGDATVTRETVRWQTADQKPMLTSVDSPDARRFLLESVDEEPDIADAASAVAHARGVLELASNPRQMTCDLTADAPTTCAQLVPGRITDFRLSTLPIATDGLQRLQTVAVSVSHQSETVTVTTTPVGHE